MTTASSPVAPPKRASSAFARLGPLRCEPACQERPSHSCESVAGEHVERIISRVVAPPRPTGPTDRGHSPPSREACFPALTVNRFAHNMHISLSILQTLTGVYCIPSHNLCNYCTAMIQSDDRAGGRLTTAEDSVADPPRSHRPARKSPPHAGATRRSSASPVQRRVSCGR